MYVPWCVHVYYHGTYTWTRAVVWPYVHVYLHRVHTWFSVHMCTLFQSESCDIPFGNIISTYTVYVRIMLCHTCTQWYGPGRTYVHVLIMVCHNFLCHKRTCTMVRTWVHVRTRTYNVVSQLSDWKRAHMCTDNHVLIMLCHNFLIGRGHTRTVRTYVPCTYVPRVYVRF
jgi:hypothetical protein